MIAPLFKTDILNEIDKLQIIEIPIPGAGQPVSFEIQSLTSMYNVLGIAIVNPTPKDSGHGTLRLRIGDDEIFPNEFHVDLITRFNPSHVNTKMDFGFKQHVFPTKVKAKGKPVKVNYVEPADGGSGKLHLYLLGKKSYCNHPNLNYRFQVMDIDVPKGNNTNDIEVEIDQKTRLNDERVKGVMLVGNGNRLKECKLCIDGNSVLPGGFQAQLVTKEQVTNTIVANGIYTKHVIPTRYILHPTDQKARNSKVEGKIVVTPNPDKAYNFFLYLLTTR